MCPDLPYLFRLCFCYVHPPFTLTPYPPVQHHVVRSDAESAIRHVAPAVKGFFRSVALGQASGDRTGNLQVGGGGGHAENAI